MGKNPNSNESRKLYVSLPPEVYETFEALAKEQGRPVSSLAAFALEHFASFVAPKIYPLSRTVRQYEINDELDE